MALSRSGDPKGQVDVEVEIDATGRVTGAKAVRSTGWAGRLMMPQAEAAARRWSFEPARLNGEAVPSRMVLSFRLGEENR
jgi:TonB family protein